MEYKKAQRRKKLKTYSMLSAGIIFVLVGLDTLLAGGVIGILAIILGVLLVTNSSDWFTDDPSWSGDTG